MKVRWFLILLMMHTVAVRTQAIGVEEFLRSYREARAQAASRYDHCRAQGTMTESITDSGANSPRRRLVQDYDYTRSGDDEKLVIKTKEAMIGGEDKASLYPEGVVIRRGSKVYAIKGSAGNNDYSLAYLGSITDPKVRSSELEKSRGRFFRPSLDAPGFNLPVFLGKPELAIQSVKAESRDGESLIRVDYTLRAPDPKLPIQRAWCLLRSDRDYSLREFETTTESVPPYSYSGVINYESGSSDAPRPKAVQLTLKLPTSIQSTEFSYSRFDSSKASSGEFSLAPYGMGEIETPVARPTNQLPFWLGGIALVAFILSVWLRVVLIRRDRQARLA